MKCELMVQTLGEKKENYSKAIVEVSNAYMKLLPFKQTEDVFYYDNKHVVTGSNVVDVKLFFNHGVQFFPQRRIQAIRKLEQYIMTAVRMGNPNVIQVRSLTANILLAEESFLLPSIFCREMKENRSNKLYQGSRNDTEKPLTINFLDLTVHRN